MITTATGALPRLPGPWVMSVRAFRCWLVMYRRTWRSSVWSPVFGPLFYLGAMGYGLGSLVDKNAAASLGGVPYVVFVAPAVLGVLAMNSGLTNAMFPVFGGIHWNKIYLAARASMLRPADIYRGHLLFIAMRIAMNSACFVAVMAALGLIRSWWSVLLLPAATLLGVVFATPAASWAVPLETQTPMKAVCLTHACRRPAWLGHGRWPRLPAPVPWLLSVPSSPGPAGCG